jgi:hypothetical protein
VKLKREAGGEERERFHPLLELATTAHCYSLPLFSRSESQADVDPSVY